MSNNLDVNTLTQRELIDIAWEQLGVRVGRNVAPEDIHKLLQYELDTEDLPANPVNDKRDTLIEFINSHRDKLSLPCNGNCYEHCDAIVIACYAQFKEDTDG